MVYVNTIRPGLLVSLSTEIKGGVSYEREEIRAEHWVGDAKEAEWQTRKRIEDAAEYERAVKVRGKARSLVVAQCAQSRHGLLCPVANEVALLAAITEAQTLAADYNAGAVRSRVEVYVILGRVADSDVDAQRAINAEVRSLLDAMEAGIRAADPKAIRDAANRAREVGQILTESARGKVTAAMEEARKVAREVVRRVQKEGEEASKVVEGVKVDAIQAARFAFLDLDESRPIEPSAAPVAAVDLSAEEPEIESPPPSRTMAAVQPEIEF